MAKRVHKKAKGVEIIRGSGNVFADIGFADADERQTKLRLAYEPTRLWLSAASHSRRLPACSN